LARLADERAAQASAIAERREKMAELENRRHELEDWAAAAHNQLRSLRERRDLGTQSVSETKARVAALSERHRAAASVLERIEQLVGEMRVRVRSLTDEIEGAVREKHQREAQNQELAERLVSFASERRAGEARAALLEIESGEGRARRAELDGILREARAELDRLRDQKAERATLAVKLQSDAEHLSQMLMNELGLTRGALLADSTLARLSREELAREEQACQEMRARLEAMGPVNMMALEEYRETAERQAFLENQRKDLLDSISNTQATIKEIDTFSRQRFDEAFAKINENFQTTFRKLFGGGHALMRLTDEENTSESGIDVVASPPGKRLQNVLLLSGGEKAMTALALLVGIFQYQPSPFCILDEVDAPLDEANIERFTDLVKEMSLQTQFVLITHSKKTMSIAPVLYGITMQEPGVSKLVSVKFGAA
jgi:chromosome segregation protein